MSALEAAEIYRPPHRTAKPGHNRKIGNRWIPPKGGLIEKKKEKSEAAKPDTWAWNTASGHDIIIDGMDYTEAFDRIVSTLAAPDPTDAHDFQSIYDTTKDENFPARNLLVAVLFSSWCDLHGFGVPLRAKKTTVLREIAWMRCTDESYIYSFGFICDMLDIDRDAVFKAMLNGTAQRRKNFATGP